MSIGKFSVSLAVKDINKSYDFYTKLGFSNVGGDINQKWVILRNDDCTIGLFQDMLEQNTLTFNPGWDHDIQLLNEFADVRELQSEWENKGIKIVEKVKDETGPGHFIIKDPDGNPILIDQHV